MSPVFGHGRLRLYLLKLLAESPRHGYDLIRELENRFLGLYSPSAGTIYPRLSRLEAEGLVVREEHEGRKVYRITESGQAELISRRDELDDLEREIAGSVKDLAAEIRTEVRASVRDLRAELTAAAKEMRRRQKHPVRPSDDPVSVELARFTDEVRRLMGNRPAAMQVAVLKDALDEALQSVRRVTGRASRSVSAESASPPRPETQTE